MMHKKTILSGGVPLEKAEKALIMIHGRGADAQGILGLATHLNVTDFALLAPQAVGYTWYPHSFLVPIEQNEPLLSSALAVLDGLVGDLKEKGFGAEQVYFLGFSQGACLALEYVTRNARRYGGVVALTGGLIGNQLDLTRYNGDFADTPFFVSTGDPDPHVPLSRVRESVALLQRMQAAVNLEVYPGRSHVISEDEINLMNKLVFK